MKARHLDILNLLSEEVSMMQEWVRMNDGEVEIEKILNTEEGAFDVEELKNQLRNILEKAY